MATRLESNSVGVKEWLESTRGWVIQAYVENEVPIKLIGTVKDEAAAPKGAQTPLPPEKRRRELPFGENIREAIRSLKG